ncbi:MULTISPECIES: site-specific integrase [unclassified Corynebacterium]|uniref:tyrosine-type recombinase/integrase n=1 Tax=unclassified Corynebacterium TaxID=2624378 RepID=UPI00124CAA67|nr:MULTISPECIES: site-specific integrase [unclassified Corynebacterium]
MLINDSQYLLAIPTGWEDALRSFELLLRARGLRESSVDTRVRHVRRFAREIGCDSPNKVTQEQLIAWSGSQRWATETRHSYYMSLLAFYRVVDEKDILASIKNLYRASRRIPPPRPAPDKIIVEAIHGTDPRTALILRLAAELGLRRGEIALVHHQDLLYSEGAYILTVHGKGGAKRTLPVPHSLGKTIEERSRITGFLFPGRVDGHLSPRHVGKLASKALPSPWSLHTLRHRFATVAYSGTGHDLIAVQHALGHNQVSTTQRYAKHHANALTHVVKATSLSKGPDYDNNHRPMQP